MSNEYRELLQKLEVESQNNYDKAVMTLSGGALAVSFAFVKDFTPIEGAECKTPLLIAWVLWGVSLAAVLLSHYFSTLALRSEIKKEDEKVSTAKPEEENAHSEGHEQTKSHNLYDTTTSILNFTSGAFFVLGVLCLAIFVYMNMENSDVERKDPNTSSAERYETTDHTRSSTSSKTSSSSSGTIK